MLVSSSLYSSYNYILGGSHARARVSFILFSPLLTYLLTNLHSVKLDTLIQAIERKVGVEIEHNEGNIYRGAIFCLK